MAAPASPPHRHARHPLEPPDPGPSSTPRRKRTMTATPSGEPPRDGAPSAPPARPAPPASGPPERGSLSGLIAEAEAVRAALHDASARLGRLAAALKFRQRHTRAL